MNYGHRSDMCYGNNYMHLVYSRQLSLFSLLEPVIREQRVAENKKTERWGCLEGQMEEVGFASNRCNLVN